MKTIRRGFTLVEVMVAAALGVLVLGLAAGYLVPALRASDRGSSEVEMEQQAVLALSQIERDAGRTTPEGLSLRAEAPVCLAVNPRDEVEPDGTVVWSDSYIIYSFDKKRGLLIRRQWPPGMPTPTAAEQVRIHPKRLTPARLAQIAAAAPVHYSVVARGVQDFRILQAGTDGLVRQPIHIVLTLQRKVPGHQTPEQWIYSRSLFVREQQ